MENQGQSRGSIESKLREISFVDRACEPIHRDFIRIVHWNIEKGKRWELLEQCLETAALQSADLLTLNEADDGMARSGNRHVALEIAERLGMRVVFAPAFFEFTKGIGDERDVPGENAIGVQGNALLTRLPVLGYRNVRLPQCHDFSHSEEKRAGGRSGLVVRLHAVRGFDFSLAVTHLELFTSRRCRAAQLEALLKEMGGGPAVIAGDFNSTTFDRGNRWRSIRSAIGLLRANVKTRVGRPWEWEPLFHKLASSGFTVDPFNDVRPTNVVDLSLLEERNDIPGFIVKRALRRGRHLPLRLDWICCRGFRAVTPGRTITDLPCEPSDHLPITCDLEPVAKN